MNHQGILNNARGLKVSKKSSRPEHKPEPYYTLVLLNPAIDLPLGEEYAIWNSHITLGRKEECDIQYDEEFPMVSRIHAKIDTQGDQVTISPVSNTNDTLLNGKPIQDSWFLENGDVIQLSYSGPKLKFQRESLVRKPSSKRNSKLLIMIGVWVIVLMLFIVWLFYVI